MWEKSFVAVSVLVGASVDDATSALGAGREGALGDVPKKLRDPSRAVRAQALAVVAQEVALALEEVTLQ